VLVTNATTRLRVDALGPVGVQRQIGEAPQHVLDGLVEVPAEVQVIEPHAQHLATEPGERLRHTGHGQGEPVTQQLGEPNLRQMCRGADVLEPGRERGHVGQCLVDVEDQQRR
jgi:hypothetical protein